jgi:hypothetical protein
MEKVGHVGGHPPAVGDDPDVTDYFEPFYEGSIQSQEANQGGKLSPSQLEDQATALGVDYGKSIDFLKQDVPGYGGNDEVKANVALLTQLRLEASNFGEVSQTMSAEEAAQYHADIKNAAIGAGSKEERGQQIRDIVSRANGGDESSLGDLTNEQITDLYDVNIHNYNHKLIVNGAGPSGVNYFNASHAFETNYASEDGYIEDDPNHGGYGQRLEGDSSPQGTLAFYDDTGAHLQRDSNGVSSLEAIVAETRDVYGRTSDAIA